MLTNHSHVSVPLRGLGSWKVRGRIYCSWSKTDCFSPLAGIRFVESQDKNKNRCNSADVVSVPLRGLGSWKVAGPGIGANSKFGFQSPCGD